MRLLPLVLFCTACGEDHLVGFGCDGPMAYVDVVVLANNQPAGATVTNVVAGDTLPPTDLPVPAPHYVVIDDGMWWLLQPSTNTIHVTTIATFNQSRVTSDFEIGYQNCAVVKIAGPDTLRLP